MANLNERRDYGAALGPLTEIARRQLPLAHPSPDLRQQQSFDAVRTRLGQDARSRLPLVFAVGGALAAAAAAGLLLVPRYQPLDVTIDGETLADNTATPGSAPFVDRVVVAPSGSEKGIHFSDGSAVTLEKTARGRLGRVTNRGARIRIEQGRARVRVVPRKGGEWLFDAGPCEVRVTGTKFDLSWSEGQRRLDVSLETGSVVVRSPLTPEGISVAGGERLIIDLDKKTFRRLDRVASAGPTAEATSGVGVAALPSTRPTAAPASEAPAPAEMPATAAPPVRTDRALAHPATHAPRKEAHKPGAWPALVAAGDFAIVLNDARREGVDDVLGRSPAPDVMALADAARFTGEVALARRAFLATRLRFAGSGQAHRAALQLGRMAEDADGDMAKALEWYDLYLGSAPRGPHVQEALGRKMTATLRLFGRAAARPVAERYLKAYTQGAYANAARAIVLGEGQ